MSERLWTHGGVNPVSGWVDIATNMPSKDPEESGCDIVVCVYMGTGEQTEAIADRIVKAANSHDALVAALEHIVDCSGRNYARQTEKLMGAVAHQALERVK